MGDADADPGSSSGSPPAPAAVSAVSEPAARLVPDLQGRPSCWWHGRLPEYQAYHDGEWGLPQIEDQRLFEKLCLEGFQSGLSWLTILRKREGFRAAFHGFDWVRMAGMGPEDVERLVQDAGIIRHRGKIEAVLGNARRMPDLIAEAGSLARFVWQFRPEPGREPRVLADPSQPLIGETAESKALSKALKARGWRFVGPTTVYAMMQACGLVNDHVAGCWRWEPCDKAQRSTRPT